MRWIVNGDLNSRHAFAALLSALNRAGVDVVETPCHTRNLVYEEDPEFERQARERIEAALPADVLLNIQANTLAPGYVTELSKRGLTTVVWLPDDPLLFRVSSRHLAPAYDLTLHSARADVLAFYERKLGIKGYSFPWWSDDAHFPYGYDPDEADIEVGFLGNCHSKRRSNRYDLLASLPWRTRYFGRTPPDGDPAGINAGYLAPEEIHGALQRFRVAVNMSQTFVGVRDKFTFKALAQFGEYFFPSRLVLYAAVGVPTVNLTMPGLTPPFAGLSQATNRDELVNQIGRLIDDRDALLAASRAMRKQFEACLSAETRVAMLLALLDGSRDHPLAERAEMWRQFGPVATGSPSAAASG